MIAGMIMFIIMNLAFGIYGLFEHIYEKNKTYRMYYR